MSRILNRRPSAALILSAIAVFMSLGGVSYGLASGSIGSPAIKNNAVRSQDVRNNNLRGKDIHGNTIRGADVLESSLGEVPSAKAAQSAQTAAGAESVDGMNLAKLNFVASPGTPLTDVVSLGGVTIEASCSAGGDVAVNARSTVENSLIHISTVDGESTADGGGDVPDDNDSRYAEDDSFDVGQLESLALSSGHDSVAGSFTFATPDGSIVTSNYLVEESAGGCFVRGTLVQG